MTVPCKLYRFFAMTFHYYHFRNNHENKQYEVNKYKILLHLYHHFVERYTISGGSFKPEPCYTNFCILILAPII